MPGDRVVRVWFGSTVVARYSAAAEAAADYAAAMDRRFPGLRISDDPALPEDAELRRMPGERLWVDEQAAS